MGRLFKECTLDHQDSIDESHAGHDVAPSCTFTVESASEASRGGLA